MRYIDRNGELIPADVWAKLYRRASYAIVSRKEVQRGGKTSDSVTISWIGLWAAHEEQALPYVVEHKSNDARHSRDSWHPTEAAARTEQLRLLRSLGVKL